MPQIILGLTAEKAKEFFLKGENYCTIELPIYFKFDSLLGKIDNKYSESEQIYKKNKKSRDIYPSDYEDVNYKLFNNKDGKYAWRLLQLIHPVLYVKLVNDITNDWSTIKEAFKRFSKNENIICASIPVANQNQQISTWVKEVEQKSIEMALEYRYIFETDITDCYGAIYTHSIPWAIHTKEIAKITRNNKGCTGNKIDKLLQGMNYGQTNGIPQGSVLMDFIAEMVLGYIDEQLSAKITDITDYKIIRYRDDYRIFTNDINTGKTIIKELANILADMGMRLGADKTKQSNDIIISAIKADKLQSIIDNRTDSNDLQKQLLYIKNLVEQHPNSGQLIIKLSNFKQSLSKQINYQIKHKELLCIRRRGDLQEIKKHKHKQLNKQAITLISILTSIALKNPRCYSLYIAIVSEIVCKKNINKSKQIINLIIKKFKNETGSELLYLWLQRMALVSNIMIDTSSSKLLDNAERVYKNNPFSDLALPPPYVWNSEDWLDNDFQEIINKNDIIDKESMEELDCVMTQNELGLDKVFSG